VRTPSTAYEAYKHHAQKGYSCLCCGKPKDVDLGTNAFSKAISKALKNDSILCRACYGVGLLYFSELEQVPRLHLHPEDEARFLFVCNNYKERIRNAEER
jgi:hypothetical protein